MIHFLLILMAVGLFGCGASEGHHHGHHVQDHDHPHEEHEEHGHDERVSVTVPAELADTSGIVAAVAAGGELGEMIEVIGRVALSPERVSHVEARYPGVIRRVEARIGEPVTVGQVLATVESNESLREYTIPSPINGIVIERHANSGEFTGGRILFTLADYRVLTLEVPIFSKDAGRVRVGQTLTLESADRIAVSQIASMTPDERGAPVIIARAALDNTESVWTPGEAVTAKVAVSQHSVALRVENSAIQQVRGRAAVFVEATGTGHDRIYEARAVDLGRSDDRFTEVLRGLRPGERYVIDNAYILTADLEKSGAAHEH